MGLRCLPCRLVGCGSHGPDTGNPLGSEVGRPAHRRDRPQPACGRGVCRLAGRRKTWGRRSGLGLPIASICLAAMATFAVLGTGRTLLVPRAEPLTCVGEVPQVCTTAGYQRFASPAHDVLQPYVAALK